eukprot:CAMPEP_0197197402 /NCGR_PEP_ID=MMETSP1423-20130617/32848_1 /TAXON_ID=476441 /ORGANISM="Pseudo-nitzschia heimii, Strain UNC1101" /LENGTH=369 /DNA_ID=CAMNT_0042651223 /DNA_START=198 /DNA_END=1307 /DNA_ORIENTATION=-
MTLNTPDNDDDEYKWNKYDDLYDYDYDYEYSDDDYAYKILDDEQSCRDGDASDNIGDQGQIDGNPSSAASVISEIPNAIPIEQTNTTIISSTSHGDEPFILVADTSNKQTRRGKLKVETNTATSLGAIDNRDHGVLTQLLAPIPHVEKREGDMKGRVYKLRFDNAQKRSVTLLPASIGQLNCLEELNLAGTVNMSMLPKGIGDLQSLKKLKLSSSGIKSLPSSIGKLRNLQLLDLENTKKLSKLPKDIGKLISLKNLYLRSSGIKSLPPSIGQLRYLEQIDLRNTRNLFELPNECGMLISLEKLYVMTSDIRSLPPSIGQLENLEEELDLSYTKNISKLPMEIGELTYLKKLQLVLLEFYRSRVIHEYQ